MVDSCNADKRNWCFAYAIRRNITYSDKIIELGEVLKKESFIGDTDSIIATDLTGIAAQDIALQNGFIKSLYE